MNKTIKNNANIDNTIGAIFVSIAMVIFVIIAFTSAIKRNISLQERIEAQDIIITQYETSEDWYEEMFELYEDYYKLKLDKAILEERIKWLNEKVADYELPASQMYADFIDLIDLRDTYTGTNFEDWVEATNPELYARIIAYGNMFD